MIEKKENNIKTIKLFSKVTIEALKEILAKGQEFNSDTLCRTLCANNEIKNIIAQLDIANNNQDSISKDNFSNSFDKLQVQLERVQSHREQLVKQLDEFEDKEDKKDKFYKSVMLTLTELVRSESNQEINHSINHFKSLIKKNADINILETAFLNLKNLFLKLSDEQIAQDKSKVKSLTFLGKWLKGEEDSQEKKLESKYLEHLKDSYHDIINELRLALGEEYLKRLIKIGKTIQKASFPEDFYKLRKEILSLLQDYISNVSIERKKAAEFIKEVGERIIDVESYLLFSMMSAKDMNQSNIKFSDVLKEQLEELNGNVNFCKTLEDLKSAVVSKLVTIKEAIGNKKKEDCRREEDAKKKMGHLQRDLSSMKKKINIAHEQAKVLEKELMHDPLTGALNRRAYDKRLKEEMHRYLRYHSIFSMLLFDVDHFKNVNDQYGHAVGDKCLKEIIRRVKPTLRSNDLLARFGGEEFIILLPETESNGAVDVAEKIRKLIEKIEFINREDIIRITISIGVTQVQPSDQGVESLFNRVDSALYDAKNSGRNKVVLR